MTDTKTLKECLRHYGMPEENIDSCVTQIEQGYGANRYLDGVNDGAEAANSLPMDNAVPAEVTFDYFDSQDRLFVSVLATDVPAEEHDIKDKDKVKLIIVKED